MQTLPHMHRTARYGLPFLLALAWVLLAAPAAASEPGRLGVDWSLLAEVLRTPPQLLRSSASATSASAPVDAADEAAAVPWVGRAPRLSLVARDWADCRPLLGALSLIDELRPSSSSRMVVSRLRLADGRVSPFAQVGLGEWRVDTSLFPSLPRTRELAAQAGVGFEVALAPGIDLALESGFTWLQPQTSSDVLAHALAQMHPSMLSSYLAVRSRF